MVLRQGKGAHKGSIAVRSRRWRNLINIFSFATLVVLNSISATCEVTSPSFFFSSASLKDRREK